jgi:hypothetical protein
VKPVGEGDTAEEYLEFGDEAAGSPTFRDWALGVARDPEVLALLHTLPPAKRQPNLVFAAARWHGARPGPYQEVRGVLLDRWDDVRATVQRRATQTNEVGRCATLLPVLAGLASTGSPLALLEVGASAGLCLYPDRYSYRYTGSANVRLDPGSGPSPVVLECIAEGAVPVPQQLPEVVWRAGIDLNPLDVRDDDAMRWLQQLVWPEHQDRRDRLAAAVDLVRRDPPHLVRGNLVEQLPPLVAEAPEEATLVVFHSAVVAYLSGEERSELAALMGRLRGHWVSNEGAAVLPALAATAASPPRDGSAVGAARFLLALDGRAVAWTQGHGRAISWIGT